jgi:hypothetical protein
MKNTMLVLCVAFFPLTAAAGQQPCRSTVVGDLRIEHLESKRYGSSVMLRIWLPAGYSDQSAEKKKYPTL